MVSKYGTVVKIFLGHRPYVVVTGAKAMEAVLSSNRHITKGPDYRFLWPWLNQGLLTAAGAKWHGRRKLLTPAFHFRILDDFRSVMNDQSAILVDKLKALAGTGREEDVFPRVTYCALDIICQAALGTHYNSQGMKEQSPYVKSGERRVVVERCCQCHSGYFHMQLFCCWCFPPPPASVATFAAVAVAVFVVAAAVVLAAASAAAA